ncbi:hypothetical protein JHK87_049959 [Glycine soja]|nr:hypothetical protein JHK87_049959 [Glycine soja]
MLKEGTVMPMPDIRDKMPRSKDARSSTSKESSMILDRTSLSSTTSQLTSLPSLPSSTSPLSRKFPLTFREENRTPITPHKLPFSARPTTTRVVLVKSQATAPAFILSTMLTSRQFVNHH